MMTTYLMLAIGPHPEDIGHGVVGVTNDPIAWRVEFGPAAARRVKIEGMFWDTI